MDGKLSGKKVAILVADGFEQIEVTEPKKALEQAGAVTFIVSPNNEQVKGWQMTDWGDTFPVDIQLDEANAEEFDALLMPGGVMNPDKLRWSEKAIDFVSDFVETGKPIASICHGPWTLINADAVEGLTMTSYPSIKQDLINAGATWIDQEVVTDQGIVTSRTPDDIPAFNKKMIEEFAEGTHEREESQPTANPS